MSYVRSGHTEMNLELGIEDGVIFKGKQVLIPECMRRDILQQLHQGHQGIEKTRMLARESVYWQKINEDIEKLTKRCVACQELQYQNSKEPMIISEVQSEAWLVLGTYLFGVKGRTFIILSDYYSKYPIVEELQAQVTSAAVTCVIEDACAMFGRPDQIRSDNGPQYAGQHFRNFCKRWVIQHVTYSLHYAQPNGFSERQVRWIKSIIKKCIKTSESIPQALHHVRATPVDAKLPSTAPILMRRQITTCLPSHLYDLPDESIKARLEERSEAMKRHYDRNAREDDLPSLHPGHNVRVLDKPSKTWYQGTVTHIWEEPQSYIRWQQGTSQPTSLARNN